MCCGRAVPDQNGDAHCRTLCPFPPSTLSCGSQHTEYSSGFQYSWTSIVLNLIMITFLIATIVLILNLIIAAFNYTYSKVNAAAEAELKVWYWLACCASRHSAVNITRAASPHR